MPSTRARQAALDGPVSHDPVPPTAGTAYDGFPVMYGVGKPGYLQCTDASLVVCRERLAGMDAKRQYQLLAFHVAPDGTPVVTGSWAGGTWGGRCGSTMWVRDPDCEIRRAYQTLSALTGKRTVPQVRTAVDAINRSQHWWLHEVEHADTWFGFRVECPLSSGHDGLCEVTEWQWNRHTMRPA